MYNLVVLRLISFGMDLHWTRRGAAAGRAPPPPARLGDSDSLKVGSLSSTMAHQLLWFP